MRRALWEWILCLLRVHVGWTGLNRRRAIAFECRRCRTTVWLRRTKRRA